MVTEFEQPQPEAVKLDGIWYRVKPGTWSHWLIDTRTTPRPPEQKPFRHFRFTEFYGGEAKDGVIGGQDGFYPRDFVY